MALDTHDVDGLPVVCGVPDGAPRGVALWMTHLGGSTEQTAPMLERLARRGLLAVSFDPPGHGRRGTGDGWALAGAVLSSFRRRMWPLAGQTVLECLRVLDWVDAAFDVGGPRVAGGVSMGGDVTVALAGIDRRVSRVSALIATPDWTRPGMTKLDDPSTLLDPGEADSYARWFYERLDPMTHLDAYRRDVALDFQSGGADHHVPVEAAQRFRARLVEMDPRAAARIRVDVHDGLDHMGGGQSDRLYANAVEWLTA